jgi:6-phosphogluconolactonase
MEPKVLETPDAMAEAAADRLSHLITSEAKMTLGIAGGSTPEATYHELRTRDLDWKGVEAWLSDERWVPPDHERSNGRMAALALFDHVDANFHRPLWSEHLTADDSAAHYEATIRRLLGDDRPDVIMLGLGEDGHTASLFPETAALDERARWFVSNYVPALEEERLTATLPLLWKARLVMVLATGSNKARAVAESFTNRTPAGQLARGEAAVEWYLDREAASLLD